VRAVPARVRLPRTAERQTPVSGPDRSSRPRGTEPNLLAKVASWQADDFWQYAMSAACQRHPCRRQPGRHLSAQAYQELDLNRPTSSCARSPADSLGDPPD